MSLISDVRLFPVMLMVLYVCACVRYAIAGDTGRVVYWFAALLINYAATFMIGGHK